MIPLPYALAAILLVALALDTLRELAALRREAAAARAAEVFARVAKRQGGR